MFGLPAIYTPPDYFRELRHDELFADPSRPLEIDLGCGEGSFLIAMAREHPERDFLGVERQGGRVMKVAQAAKNEGLGNVKVMCLETAYTMRWLLPSACATRVHLLCPDPWPKAGHARRRLVNHEEFLSGLCRVLRPEGEFLLKTDDTTFHEDALASLGAVPVLQRCDWPEQAFFYPQTDFERHWLRLDRAIHRARWKRLA